MVLLMLVSINGCVLAHILGAYLHLLYRLFEQLLFILTIRNMTLIEKYNLSLYYSYYFTCNHLFCSYRQGNCVPKKNRLYKTNCSASGNDQVYLLDRADGWRPALSPPCWMPAPGSPDSSVCTPYSCQSD